VPAARQKIVLGRDVVVAGQAQRSACCREASTAEKWPLSGGLFFGEAHVAMDAKDGVLGSEIAQGQGGIEAEDEALDEVFEDSPLSLFL